MRSTGWSSIEQVACSSSTRRTACLFSIVTGRYCTLRGNGARRRNIELGPFVIDDAGRIYLVDLSAATERG